MTVDQIIEHYDGIGYRLSVKSHRGSNLDGYLDLNYYKRKFNYFTVDSVVTRVDMNADDWVPRNAAVEKMIQLIF